MKLQTESVFHTRFSENMEPSRPVLLPKFESDWIAGTAVRRHAGLCFTNCTHWLFLTGLVLALSVEKASRGFIVNGVLLLCAVSDIVL